MKQQSIKFIITACAACNLDYMKNINYTDK